MAIPNFTVRKIRPPIGLYEFKVTAFQVTTGSLKILGNNPRRVALFCIPHPNDTVFYFPVQRTATPLGWPCVGTSGQLEFTWDKYGSIINGDWWAMSVPGNIDGMVVELLAT